MQRAFALTQNEGVAVPPCSRARARSAHVRFVCVCVCALVWADLDPSGAPLFLYDLPILNLRRVEPDGSDATVLFNLSLQLLSGGGPGDIIAGTLGLRAAAHRITAPIYRASFAVEKSLALASSACPCVCAYGCV